MPSWRIRRFTELDIAAGLRLCRAAGWNQLERDWRVFLESNPEGCFAAEEGDRVIGAVTTIRYDGGLAWISMLLVDPAQRGGGIGTALLAQALDALRDVACIKLDATPDGRRVYLRNGFQDEFALGRWESEAGGTTDAEASPMIEPGHPACDLAYCWELSNGDWIGGRPGYVAGHLGPVVASTPENAARLIQHARASRPERRFFLDAPDTVEGLGSLGFTKRRELIRMYRGALQPSPDGAFAIIGPEFG